jgi:hypothetical protein
MTRYVCDGASRPPRGSTFRARSVCRLWIRNLSASTNGYHALSRDVGCAAVSRMTNQRTDLMSSSGAPLVPMVQAANLRDRNHVAYFRRLHRT